MTKAAEIRAQLEKGKSPKDAAEIVGVSRNYAEAVAWGEREKATRDQVCIAKLQALVREHAQRMWTDSQAIQQLAKTLRDYGRGA